MKNEFPIAAFADTAWTETQKRPGNIREKDTTVNAEATQPRIQQFSVIHCTYFLMARNPGSSTWRQNFVIASKYLNAYTGIFGKGMKHKILDPHSDPLLIGTFPHLFKKVASAGQLH